MNKEIVQWSEISNEFKENLFVGNGGAIAAVGDCFNYNGLFEVAKKQGLIKGPVQEVFHQVAAKHPDFERVLYQLWLTDFINTKFELEKSQRDLVREGYTGVRRALIDTIKAVHPTFETVEDKIQKIGDFVAGFSTVFYLNYDLLLYWAILAKNSLNKHRCKDGFVEKVSKSAKSVTPRLKFTDDLNFIWKPYGSNQKATAVFYPHGSLMLYQTRALREERKLGLSGHDSLKRITEFWANYDAQPLFVCEGNSEEKLKAISGSQYLSQVFNNVLPMRAETLTIYGWNMGKQDRHILQQLKNGAYKRVAVSIYTHGKSAEKLKVEKSQICESLKDIVNEKRITFFDSESANCWCN